MTLKLDRKRLDRGNTRLLLRSLTLSAVLLAYSGVNNSAYGGDMADAVLDPKMQAQRDAEIKAAVDSPNWAPFQSLMEMREICATGAMHNVKAEMDAKGIGYPEVPAMCRAVVEGAAKRELSGALYLELALRDLHGGTIGDDENIALVSNEHVQYLGAIVKSASKGDDKYSTLSGKVVPLRPEQSYDAGFWLGQVKPDGLPALPREVADSVADQCFSKEPAKSITINNQEIPATKACLVAAAILGKELFLSKEKAELPARLTEQQYAERSAEIARSIVHTYAIDRENRTFADNLARKHGVDLTAFDNEREEIERKRKEAETKGDHLGSLEQRVLEGHNTLNRLYAVPDERLTKEERSARDKRAAEQVTIIQQRGP